MYWGIARRATNWWLRSPNTNDSTNAWNVNSNGNANNNNCSNSYGVRPALMEKLVRVGICRKLCTIIKGGYIPSKA